MSSCSSRALTLLSTVFGACGLLLVGVAVATDYWLLMEEGIVLQQNQTIDVKMALHSGLWRVCFIAGAHIHLDLSKSYIMHANFCGLWDALHAPKVGVQIIRHFWGVWVRALCSFSSPLKKCDTNQLWSTVSVMYVENGS